MRTGIPGYTAGDNVRQKFTSKERDNETGLDYFLARYYSSTQGRFTSTDPLYFQMMMAIDPQRFNLYAYTRNNPLKYADPSGEDLYLRGTQDWLTTNVLYPMVGGQENFDRYFQITNGQVLAREGVDTSGANSGVQELLGYVNASQNYLYYAGTDGGAVADLFQGSRDNRGNLTGAGREISDEFTGSGDRTQGVGSVVGTRGRMYGFQEPANLVNGDPVFAVIAINTNAVFTQSAISNTYPGEGEMLYNAPLAFSAQSAGVGQVIRRIAFSLWAERETVKFGQDITIKYKVANDSSKAIYLVWDNTSKPEAERGEITIREPLVTLGGHEGYDYSFTKVERGKTFQGKLIIQKDRYGKARLWRVNVGFGYVTNIVGLNRALNQGEDPLPMKVLLNARIKTLLLGSFRIEVIENSGRPSLKTERPETSNRKPHQTAIKNLGSSMKLIRTSSTLIFPTPSRVGL